MPFGCGYCQYTSAFVGNVKKHLNSRHSGMPISILKVQAEKSHGRMPPTLGNHLHIAPRGPSQITTTRGPFKPVIEISQQKLDTQTILQPLSQSVFHDFNLPENKPSESTHESSGIEDIVGLHYNIDEFST